MARYGKYCVSTHRSNSGKPHELAAFNLELIEQYLEDEIIWAFDPCYLTKSEKKTADIGRFWSGCANATKWGIEISSIAAVDIKQQTAMHYLVKQTPAGLKKEAALNHYSSVIL